MTFDESTATPFQRQLVEKATEVALAFSDCPLEQSSAIKIKGPILAEVSPDNFFAPEYLGQEYYEVVFIDHISAFYYAVVQLLPDLTPMFVCYSKGYHSRGYGFEKDPYEVAKNDTILFPEIKYKPIVPEKYWPRMREARKNNELPGAQWHWWWD